MTQPTDGPTNGAAPGPLARVGTLISRLIEPPAATPARWRDRLRLLSGVMLALMGLGLLAALSLGVLAVAGDRANQATLITSIVALALLTGAYALTRTGRYLPAAILTVVVVLLAVMAPTVAEPEALADNSVAIAYLAIPIVLGGLLLPPRYAGGLAALVLGLAWTLHATLTDNPPLALFYILVLLAAVSLLVVVGAAIRDHDAARIGAQARALGESSQRFTSAFDQAANGMALVALDGRWMQVNQALCRLLDYDEAGLRRLTLVELMVPEDRDNDAAQRTALLAGEVETYQVEKRCLSQRGQVVWIQLSVSLVRDEAGQPGYFVIQCHDIGLRKAAEAALQDTNTRLTAWLVTVEQRTAEMVVLNELGEMLQACATPDEAFKMVSDSARQLFPGQAGAICVQSASRTSVETMAEWGPGEIGAQVFAPDDCWALRRGRAHISPPDDPGRRCRHLAGPGETGAAHLCLPLMAQGESLGLLHLELAGDAGRQLAQTLADNMALALTNLKLRETLRSQSIRDVLTGLYNRRYLEETMERELRRAERANRPLGLIMLDIDHFKLFNDTYGHGAGDAALHELGDYLLRQIRGSDIACRLGGEEFVIILPEAALDAVRKRAVALQSGLRHLTITYGGQVLGPVVISAGIAMFPEHGATGEVLLKAADSALYQAKRDGRDRVVVFA